MAVTLYKNNLFKNGPKRLRIKTLKRRLSFAYQQWNREFKLGDDPSDILFKKTSNPRLMHLEYKMPKLATKLRALGEDVPVVPGEKGFA